MREYYAQLSRSSLRLCSYIYIHLLIYLRLSFVHMHMGGSFSWIIIVRGLHSLMLVRVGDRSPGRGVHGHHDVLPGRKSGCHGKRIDLCAWVMAGGAT